ncbi:hypothetical protein A6R68_11583, partial [Neotoma lepida]
MSNDGAPSQDRWTAPGQQMAAHHPRTPDYLRSPLLSPPKSQSMPTTSAGSSFRETRHPHTLSSAIFYKDQESGMIVMPLPRPSLTPSQMLGQDCTAQSPGSLDPTLGTEGTILELDKDNMFQIANHISLH